MNVLEILPQVVLYGFLAALGVFFVTYVLARLRPATDEAVIGHYTFHLLSSGEKVKGLTSLAQRHISPRLISVVKRAMDEGLIKGNPVGEEDLSLYDLYAYGIRDGFRKVLIVSKTDIQAPPYSQSEPGLHLSLHGWITYRHVYCYEVPVEVDKRWSRVYVIQPLNIEKHKVEDADWEGMKAVGELAANLKAATEVLEKEMAWKRIRRVFEDRYQEATDRLAEEVDRRLTAELEEAERGIAPEMEEEEVGLLPRLSTWQWISLAVAFYLGYQYGVPYLKPHYPTIVPWQAGLVFAILLYAAYFLYYKWWKER